MAELSTPSFADEFLEFVHGLSWAALPSSVQEQAKLCVIDTLGCALFGSQQLWSQIVSAEIGGDRSNGPCSVFAHDGLTAAAGAALCNGTAAHGFELDDVIDEAILHPGAMVIPAALATAEATGASGERVLLGVIAGYEAAARVGVAIGVDPARRGWHKTAIVGPIAAAVAAGVVRSLTLKQLSAAVGLACSAAGGTKSFATGFGGGMIKRLHSGRAAEAGVRMSSLAARDFEAPMTALDGRFGAIEILGGSTAQPELLVAGMGRRWAVDNVYRKVYPICSWLQAAVQQLVTLRGPRPIAPSRVRHIRIGVNAYAIDNNGAPAPIDTMGAQYSIPFSAAIGLTSDPSDPASYSAEAISDPARRALSARVELYVDPEMESLYPKHYGARVELGIDDAAIQHSVVFDPHGMPADPCSAAELHAKFRRLASSVKSAETIEKILVAVDNLQGLSKVEALTLLLRGARAQA